jgi:hypothetical protein
VQRNKKVDKRLINYSGQGSSQLLLKFSSFSLFPTVAPVSPLKKKKKRCCKLGGALRILRK